MNDPHPSTSKQDAKEDRNTGSGSDRKTDRNSNNSSRTNVSWLYSSHTGSNIDMAHVDLQMPKPGLRKREERDPKSKDKFRQSRRAGISKRKYPAPKRNNARKAPPKKPQNRRKKKERNLSISTIFTRLSSGCKSHICQYCGHKCSGRRSPYSSKEKNYRRCKRQHRRKPHKKPMKPTRYVESESGSMRINNTSVVGTQAGSRANMLSPLFVKTNATLEDSPKPNTPYSEVSPEMIHEALRSLSMWRAEVKTEAILKYIKITYPVNPNPDELLTDLQEKLRIAALVGIVIKLGTDFWRLPTALQKRSLTETHVTVFWNAYADTMKPVAPIKPLRISEVEDQENQTEAMYT